MAEHSTVNRRVAGSSPAWGVFYCRIKAGLVPALDLTKVFKVGQLYCNKVSGLRRADGAIISGNRLVLRISGVGNNQTM